MTTESNRELIAMLEGGPDLSLQRVIEFLEEAFGPMTDAEREEVQRLLVDLPEK